MHIPIEVCVIFYTLIKHTFLSSSKSLSTRLVVYMYLWRDDRLLIVAIS